MRRLKVSELKLNATQLVTGEAGPQSQPSHTPRSELLTKCPELPLWWTQETSSKRCIGAKIALELTRIGLRKHACFIEELAGALFWWLAQDLIAKA